MRKSLITLLKPFIMPVLRTYWFIFRPKTSGALIAVTHAGEALLLTHTYRSGFGLVGGGIQKNETPEQAARREAFEEIGVKLETLTPLGSFTSTVEYKRDTIFTFTAELPNKNISIDNLEIAEVHWFPLEHIPPLGPVGRKVFELFNEHRTA
jgi:8-oxo-dGTP pyrophosphatase MutT (NUDIX family)